MINYADYEFHYGAFGETLAIKRYPAYITVYLFKGDKVTGSFTLSYDEFDTFTQLFANRYVRGYNPREVA